MKKAIISILKRITNIIIAEDENELSNTLNKVAKAAKEFIHCDTCTIWLYDIKKNQLTLKGAAGRHEIGIDKFFYKKGQGLTWYVYEKKEPLKIKDASSMTEWHGKYLSDAYPESEHLKKKGGAFLGVPIIFRKKCLGTLAFGSIILDVEFTDRDLDFAQIIANEIAMAFNRQSENLEQSLLRIERIQFNSEFNTALLSCKRLEEIYHITTSKTLERLTCRTASIFLFSKEGMLERKFIAGFSKENEPPPEFYKRGQGLAGLSVRNPDGFGEPCRCNDISNWSVIQDDPVVKQYARQYEVALKKQYGENEKLRHVIAIPLNGISRAFGVLRIINKIDTTTNTLSETGFTLVDEEWLILIASLVSAAIANIKKQIRQDSIFRINDLLSLNDESNFFDSVTKRIAQDDTNCYSRCTIYKVRQETKEIVFGGSSEQADAATELKHKLIIGKELAQKIISTKKHEIVQDITVESHHFLNHKAAKESGFVSMICLPLKNVKTEAVYGTFSIFTKFKYTFDQVDIDYLSMFTQQISLVLQHINEKIEKDKLLE